MWSGKLARIFRGNWKKGSISRQKSNLQFNMSTIVSMGNPTENAGKATLAKDLAFLIEELANVDETIPKTRVELKRLLELRIKKRVKEQYKNGKFQNLVQTVIANPKTLQDAYNCIRVNSNIEFDLEKDCIIFSSLAEELSSGTFDVAENVFCISTKKGLHKETLFLPNLNAKVVQEAIKVVLEVVFRPHFSKISHGCRSGRGHFSALRYICKDISSPDWWFTLNINKKLDADMLDILVSAMEVKIDDPNLYVIIRSMFEAQILNLEFGGFPKGHGLPQEGVLSPILMNIYLDQFDSECYKMSMKYEAIDKKNCVVEYDDSKSKLRYWFRRQIKDAKNENNLEGKPGVKICSCRFMDEIFFAISGSENIALNFKSEMTIFLQDSLLLNSQGDLLSSSDPRGIRFLGTSIRRSVIESPAVRAVHKLKEKVELFALQKRENWDNGTVRIGKKWLAHGLKKVKESEIEHLADKTSILSQISIFRKAGMETDHWYKVLLKVWMQDINAKYAENEELIISKCIAEPALPKELRDSFYEFQKKAEEYVSSESASLAALMPNFDSSSEPLFVTEVIAPLENIKKRLLRYGLINSKGVAHTSHMLITQDSMDIIDWFSGLASRWLRWYSECQNFSEIKLIICNQVRKSCIRTLASKYRIYETDIEKKFDTELSRIPSTDELEAEVINEVSNINFFNNDEALMYGIPYSGLCLFSLARIVSDTRPCNCFVMGCMDSAPCVYNIHVMERQKYPGWKTGFSSCIHPSLNKRRIGLCKKHLKDLYLGLISLQSIDFGAWEKHSVNKGI